jgi:hypothetical protein
MVVTRHTPDSLRIVIERTDKMNEQTLLKGTEDTRVGDLLELWDSDTTSDMTVVTSDRGVPKPVGASITVETFGQLQTVFRKLGLNTLDDTGLTEDREGFVVDYYFD